MPTMNKNDMMDCCRGWHDFSDGATECLVGGAGEDEASAPNATGLARHRGIVPPPSPSMIPPADPVRDAAPDMLAALRGIEPYLPTLPIGPATTPIDWRDWNPAAIAAVRSIIAELDAL